MSENTQKIQVLIVDDHLGMREGIRAIVNAQPDMIVAGEAADGEEAIQRFKDLQPNITLADVNLPVICGIKAVEAIRAEFPNARIIVITALDDDDYTRRALAAGAQAVLHKVTLRRDLLSAIRAIHAGDGYLPVALANRFPPETL